MAVRDDRSDVQQTTAGFRGPLMVQSLTSAKSKFLSLSHRSRGSHSDMGWKERREGAKRVRITCDPYDGTEVRTHR